MTIQISSDLEALIQKQIQTGAFATAEEVVAHALDSMETAEDWMAENRETVAAMIDEGWEAAQRGDLADEAAVRAEMEQYKQEWLKQRRTA